MANSSHSPGGMGEIFPDATLLSCSRGTISLDRFRPRFDLVLVMLGEGALSPDVARLLDELARARVAIEAEEGKVVAIAVADLGHTPTDWRWPFPLLLDETGRLHERVGAVDAAGRPSATLYVTDRYREIYGKMHPGETSWPKSADDVVQWLTFINIQCPECNVPEW